MSAVGTRGRWGEGMGSAVSLPCWDIWSCLHNPHLTWPPPALADLSIPELSKLARAPGPWHQLWPSPGIPSSPFVPGVLRPAIEMFAQMPPPQRGLS